MTEEDTPQWTDESAKDEAERALETVNYATENPQADDAAERLRETADSLSPAREETQKSMRDAADLIEQGDYDEAAANLGSLKFALTLVNAIGGGNPSQKDGQPVGIGETDSEGSP